MQSDRQTTMRQRYLAAAQLGLWLTASERLFSPKETLKSVSWEAEIGTHWTPRIFATGA
jgi:hypothetical protein